MSHNDKILIIKHVSDCRLKYFSFGAVLLTGLKWLRSNVPRGMTELRQTNVGNYMKKYFLHLIFTFYLNTDASVIKIFPVVVFQ